jgi:ubiquinone/menaquinone biosynthesis C-methylase UbiE
VIPAIGLLILINSSTGTTRIVLASRWRTNMSVKAVDTWAASEYNKTAPFVYSTANITPLLTLLDPKPGDKIIDFGCGTGEITLMLSEVVADPGVVVGIDSSQSMASA